MRRVQRAYSLNAEVLQLANRVAGPRKLAGRNTGLSSRIYCLVVVSLAP